MKKKLFGLMLALIMLVSVLGVGFVPKTAVADAGPVDQAIVQGGAILHCFDWSYNEIKAALPEIAAAGYVAVQTSPVQPPKDYNAAWTDSAGQWWKLYQPLGLCIAPDVDGAPTSWLGTKAELTALCAEAKNYDIYVIVDIVANHLANYTGGGYYLDKDGNGQPDDLNGDGQIDEQDTNLGTDVYADMRKVEYFHTTPYGIDYRYDDDRYNITQKHMDMPDLNTGNAEIQQMVLDLLKECVDCGVDGFRFDAAKHIELPTDTGTDLNGNPWNGSTFWSTVLGGVREYAGADKLFIYGESLSGNAGTAWVDGYTSMMALTDSDYGGRMRTAVQGSDAGLFAVGGYTRSNIARGNVIWVESHDTYEDGASSGIRSDQIVKAWAVVGARAGSTALYLARPNEIMGKASSDTTWKSKAVSEVNKFKNYYNGQSEYLAYQQENQVVYIERGEKNHGAGVVISKLNGAGAVSLTANRMSDGYYTDEVTGNIFTVSNGTITGNVGPTGVAVVYKTATVTPPTPSEYITANPIYFVPTGWWLNDNARFEMHIFNNNGATAWVTLTDSDGDGTYEAALPEGNWTGLIFVRMDPNKPEHTFDSKWNQTDNLVPDVGTNCFTITSGSSSGTWSVYGGTSTNPDAGYYLVGTMTGWSVLPEYKMTRTGAETEEYMIDVPLLRTSKPYHSKVKAVYSPDGVTAQTWYPDGLNKDYGNYYDEDTKTGEIPISGVYTVYFRPGYDGGSDWHENCLYAQRTKYFVTVNDADKNGTVTVDKDIAAAGETVTVTVTPNEGYVLDTLVYQCETGFNTGVFNTTEIEGTTFTMPAENAAVKATFKKLPSFETKSLLLSGQIGVRFWMDLSGLTDEEKAASYMTFTISGRGDVSVDPVPFDPSTDAVHPTKGYNGFICRVNAIQMADTITATFHYGEGQTVSTQYAVSEYFDRFEQAVQNGTYTEENDKALIDLVHALADYGHYVQLFLQEQRGWELGEGDNRYMPLQTYYATGYDYSDIVARLEADNDAVDRYIGDPNVLALTESLQVESETKIYFYIKTADGYTGTPSVNVDSNSAEPFLKSGRYAVEISGISAHKLGEVHNVTVYTDDSGAYSYINASAISYVHSLLTSAAYANNTNAKNAVSAIYAYWQAALAYRN